MFVCRPAHGDERDTSQQCTDQGKARWEGARDQHGGQRRADHHAHYQREEDSDRAGHTQAVRHLPQGRQSSEGGTTERPETSECQRG